MKLLRLTLILIVAALVVLAGFKWFGDTAGRQDLVKAEELFVSGRAEEAQQAFADFVRHHPDSELLPQALLGLARIDEVYFNQPRKAVQAYRRLTALFPDSEAAIKARQAEARLLAGKLDDPLTAVAVLQELQKRRPKAKDAYQYQTGRIWFDHNQYDQARTVFAALLKQTPDSAFASRAAIGLADVLYVQDKVDKAIKAYKQVIKDYPESAEAMRARFRIANCLEEAGRLKEAKKAYLALKGIYPNPEAVVIRIKGLDKRLKEGVK